MSFSTRRTLCQKRAVAVSAGPRARARDTAEPSAGPPAPSAVSENDFGESDLKRKLLLETLEATEVLVDFPKNRKLRIRFCSPPDAPQTLLDTLLDTPANSPHGTRTRVASLHATHVRKNVTYGVTEHHAHAQMKNPDSDFWKKIENSFRQLLKRR